MKRLGSNTIPVICSIVAVLVLFLLLVPKWHLAMTRYFDADEMAYLHWTHNVVSGSVPYRDFFFYVPPAFLYIMVPLFWLGKGAAILTVSRMATFAIYLGIVGAATVLFWIMRRRWTAILVGVFLVFLPLPSDKLIEFRPDNLAVLFSLLGLLFQFVSMEKKRGMTFEFVAGGLYGVSLLILPKTLPLVGIASLVALTESAPLAFFTGLVAPMLFFGLWILGIAHTPAAIDTILYSLTKLPFEVNRIAERYPMQPYLFFYPNATFYGMPGLSNGLIANHTVWITALLFGVGRLVAPYLPQGREGYKRELLVAGSCFLYVASYVLWYPLRHTQYLIPVAVFVAFYAADVIDSIWLWSSRRRSSSVLFALLLVVLMGLLMGIDRSVTAPKLAWTNTGDYAVLESAIRSIPEGSYVFDMVGSTVYFRDPYYVSALPFGDYERYISRPFPALSQALARTDTRIIYEGLFHRTTSLPPSDQRYIQMNYSAAQGMPGTLTKNGMKAR
jgi:hypothetical protein